MGRGRGEGKENVIENSWRCRTSHGQGAQWREGAAFGVTVRSLDGHLPQMLVKQLGGGVWYSEKRSGRR